MCAHTTSSSSAASKFESEPIHVPLLGPINAQLDVIDSTDEMSSPTIQQRPLTVTINGSPQAGESDDEFLNENSFNAENGKIPQLSGLETTGEKEETVVPQEHAKIPQLTGVNKSEKQAEKREVILVPENAGVATNNKSPKSPTRVSFSRLPAHVIKVDDQSAADVDFDENNDEVFAAKSTDDKPASSPREDVSFSLLLGQADDDLDPDESERSSFADQLATGDLRNAENQFQHHHQLADVSVRSAPTLLHLDSLDNIRESVTKPGPKKVKNYYKKQSDLIESYTDDERTVDNFVRRNSEGVGRPPSEDDSLFGKTVSPDAMRKADILAKITLGLNVLLLIIKAVASVLSGSLSIISSLIDSAVDITGGLVIWATARAIKKRDPYLYPAGRTRLEPIALIIISVVMAVASIQMIIQAVQAISSGDVEPQVGWVTIGIMLFTIATKMVLAVVCHIYGKGSPSIKILEQDHRNDCISNSVAIACAFLAQRYWVYLDPIGAILVSLYIAGTWFITGYGQIVILSGRSAKPAFINRIIKIAIEHDERVLQIDTVFVYHFGTQFLVEVHVVLDGDITLRESHDVSEPLQQKIEHLPYVERAFVHVDYEISHRPEDEHKVV